MTLKILAGELLGVGSSPSERFIDMKTCIGSQVQVIYNFSRNYIIKISMVPLMNNMQI